jgi:hypothetical protein
MKFVTRSITNETVAVWSSGDGDFMYQGGSKYEQVAKQSAFGCIFGEPIHTLFFNVNEDNDFNKLVSHPINLERQPEEKIGDMDCYVLTGSINSPTISKIIIWIGKSDFLIHQVQNFVPNGVIVVETHENIEVNPQLSKKDFIPKISATLKTLP